ncbi:MAG: efflux transporter outer membrane subunit [Hyphomonadaceae bacterium]|nr:efflux transporter outer membrane subunit [Hyphomonadaceae bacterium]
MKKIRPLWPGPAASILVAALLSACATLPERSAAATAVTPVSLGATQSLSADAASAWPQDQWWRGYNDAQLDALIEEALAHSPSLAQAQARLRAANAVAAGARGDALPSITANARVNETEQSQSVGFPADFIPSGYVDTGRATLDFSYELDFWGRNRAAIAAASSNARAAQAEAAEARLTLSTSIAAAYADLARFYAERQIAQRALDVRTQTAQLVAQRVASGLDNTGAQRQAEAGPPNARADIAALDEAIAQTRNRLAALVGAGPDRGLSINPPQIANLRPFGLPPNLASDLIGRRPDLVAARWRAEAAQSRTREAQAQFYPSVNLVAFIGAESLGLESFTDSASRIGSFGPALSLPIFEGGSLRANLRRADAERDAAIADYNATLIEALHQVADAATSERALATRLTETRAALDANEDAYRIARQRYEGGLSTFQDVLIAEDAVLTQRRIVADLESRAFVLDVALVRALGGGFTEIQG